MAKSGPDIFKKKKSAVRITMVGEKTQRMKADHDMRDKRESTQIQSGAAGRGQNTETGSAMTGIERSIIKLQGGIRKNRRRALTATILAVILAAAAVFGNRVTSENEQAITQALGQKAYRVEGEEGPEYFAKDYEDPEELREAGREMVRDIVREGIVLLRNENDALPLRKGAAVSVFGNAAVSPVYSSTAEVTGEQSLRDVLTEEKVRVNEKLWDFTQRGGGNSFSKKVEESFEEYSEAAIVVIGRKGSGTDFLEPAVEYTDEEQQKGVVTGAMALQLTEDERTLLSYVSEHFDNIIVVLNTENPMEMGFLDEYGVDGCLWTGALGQNGIKALAEVLGGRVNPSGGLPDTFVYNSFSAPASVNLGDYTITNSEEAFGDKYLVYTEGMYVGYRYYETRYEDVVTGTGSSGSFDYDKEVAFPFGFGLSYTTFELKNMSMILGKKGYEITVEAHNTGEREGKETVEFYMQRPYTNYASENGIELPSAELVGFAKTKTVQPGEYEKVKITIPEETFRTYDAYGKGTYIADGGTCLVTAAQDAHAAVNNFIVYKGKARAASMRGTGDAGLVEKIEQTSSSKVFAESGVTGEKIRNAFAEASPIEYDSEFVFLTRKSWDRSWPAVWHGGSYRARSTFLELLRPSYGEDNNAPVPVYNTTHGGDGKGIAALRETEFDDYQWSSILDQLTWRETYSVVRKGGGAVNEVLSCFSPRALIAGDAAGLNAKYGDKRGTIYPSATVLAATWSTELAMQEAHLIGEEALHAGVTFWKMPSLNLHRTAMGGRNCDSFSEDCCLTGKMAAALCRGISGKGVIPVLGKMVLSDQETNGTGVVILAGEQAIRELYLRAFEIALSEGGSGQKAVIAGMNRIGPRWCGGHIGLLTKVLRGEWGFTGIVMSDEISKETAGYADILEGLEAGTDLWQNFSNNNYMLRGAVLTYGVRGRFRQAAGRILQNVSRSNAMNGISTKTQLVYKTPVWMTARTVLSVLAVLFGLLFAWYAFVHWRRVAQLRSRLAQKKRALKRRR